MEGREESWRKDGSVNVNLDYQNTAQLSKSCINNGLITHIFNASIQIEIN